MWGASGFFWIFVAAFPADELISNFDQPITASGAFGGEQSSGLGFGFQGSSRSEDLGPVGPVRAGVSEAEG